MIWTVVGTYLLLMVLLQVPAIQRFMGSQVSQAIGKKLGTRVQVGRVDLGFLNRIIIDDITIYDQQQKRMLQAARLAGKVDVVRLLSDGAVSISSAQLFGLNADFYCRDSLSKPNFQFALDSLASRDTTSHTPLDLRIQSLVVRHGAVSYHQWDAPHTPHRFNPRHIALTGLSAHVNLNRLTDDSVSLNVKKLSFEEHREFRLRHLSFKLKAGKRHALLTDLSLELPATDISLPRAEAFYRMKGDSLDLASLRFNLRLNPSRIKTSELAYFDPGLKPFNTTLTASLDAHGTATSLNVNQVDIDSPEGIVRLKGNGHITHWDKTPEWEAQVADLNMSADGMKLLARNLQRNRIQMPKEVMRLGSIRLKGYTKGKGSAITARGDVHTDVGDVDMKLNTNGGRFQTDIKTDGINIGRILDDKALGVVAADIKAAGRLVSAKSAKMPVEQLTLKGTIGRIDYNGYTYRNMNVDAQMKGQTINGLFAMDDPNGKVDIRGTANLSRETPSANLTASVRHFNPQALRLTQALGNRTLDFDAKADFTGSSLARANGFINLSSIRSTGGGEPLQFDHFNITTGYEQDEHYIDVQSDFGNVLIRGHYSYETLAQSFINLVGEKLPSLPGLPRVVKGINNDFAIIANIYDSRLANSLLGIPIELQEPIHIKGALVDRTNTVNLNIDAPEFTYDGHHFQDANVYMSTHDDTLHTRLSVDHVAQNGRILDLDLDGYAADNKLLTRLRWDTHSATPIRGVLTAETEFFVGDNGKDIAHIYIMPSEVYLDKVRLDVQPSDIVYSKDELHIDHFKVSNKNQHIIIHGQATKNPADELTAELQDIDVKYVLDLVNFHSVEFSGLASGKAHVRDIFGTMNADADLTVADFCFEKGRMGTLSARADFNMTEGQINIDAAAIDAPHGTTIIKGYISPVKNYIDLGIEAKGTPLEFAEDFCRSFMDNVEARGNGYCRVVGDLKRVNLEGQIVANGKLDITTLNTTYTLRNDTITMIPDEIIFQNDSVFDRNNHHAVVKGALHHHNLKQMTYDISVEAQNFLAYDFHEYGTQTFYGTVYATGSCDIRGRKGEIVFNIDAQPERNSFIEYNAAGPEGINKGEFIHWESELSPEISLIEGDDDDRVWNPQQLASRPSDIRLNFLVNVTPDFTLRVLMDEKTGDKIALNGNGVLRANYFNKSGFDMFGNYLIDWGTYTMTIQNIIKKVFTFQQGSTINFGGDPFNATLNMKGQYTLPSVSLSDLQMGSSFTSNKIRVNCLMNIGGTAGAPTVTFDLDLPTLSTDAQQMVRSVINSEEDMNQQVLYLLAVGRFMPQGTNNAQQETGAQQNQTSLAMQSILSGTISQQINNVLANVMKTSNWNFGANISTGDEGFSNAEYEGLLSGRLLNNRLLFNGEFGYRNNVNTQQSNFIGDFDVQYLLNPNGNLAIKFYNKTNDRYFTRNSLTTQGIGILIKKDFNNLKDLFKKKKKTK